ncbi:MAG: winged helix-turn-helix transcriptional regulator [Deltaproteobacteria bacterium]|nr:winged helix-turn-helix transcriptional regulator [Deltaproteobacteria bacterium]
MTGVSEPALDPETRLHSDHPEALRLWLRIFTCARTVERSVDQLLKREFGSSLARFDVLAQLERAPEGLRMGELSERTLSTNGNATWLVAALGREGLVRRRAAPEDGRAVLVRLTAAGRRHFATMAKRHEAHIVSCFAGLSAGERRTVHSLLGTVKDHLTARRKQPPNDHARDDRTTA